MAMTSQQYHQQGLQYFSDGKFEEASRSFWSGLQLAESSDLWNDWATARFQSSDYLVAEQGFRRALDLDAAHLDAAANLGALLAGTNRPREAAGFLARAQSAAPAENQEQLASLLIWCQQQTEATAEPSAAVESSSDAPTQTVSLRSAVSGVPEGEAVSAEVPAAGESNDWASDPSWAREIQARRNGAEAQVLVLSQGLIQFGNSEAIAKEASAFFEAARQAAPQYQLVLASIEPSAREVLYHHASSLRELPFGLLEIPSGQVAQVVRELQPDLVHIFAADLSFITGYDLGEQRILFAATGADACRGCSGEDMEELQHLVDLGTLAIVPESSGASRALAEWSVRFRAVIPPCVTPEPAASAAGPHQPFCIGFASSPLQDAQWTCRGIPLLLDLAAMAPEMEFRLAWREQSERILRAIARRKLKNVIVQSGRIDMHRFYSGVDVILLPFLRRDGNHACPLSAVEGLLHGKPVVATTQAGCADLIVEETAGLVTPPMSSSLLEAIRTIQADYPAFSHRARACFEKHFVLEESVQRYLDCYRELLGAPRGPSLRAWRKALATRQCELAIGRESLRKYYTAQAVAHNYHRQRFATFPGNVIDQWERRAIQRTIEEHFGSRRDLNVLDIASGEGRILRALLAYESCTALDSSPAMLALSRSKIGSRFRLIREDFFDWTPEEQFDVLTCVRFLRHFQYPDRRAVYDKFRKLLRPNAMAIVDFPNRISELATRDRMGWEQYPVYDVFWTRESLREELEQNGFEVVSIAPVGQSLHGIEELNQSGEPYLWIVAFGLRSAPGRQIIKTLFIPCPEQAQGPSPAKYFPNPGNGGIGSNGSSPGTSAAILAKSSAPRENRKGKVRKRGLQKARGVLFEATVYGASGYADESLALLLGLARRGLQIRLEPLTYKEDSHNLLPRKVRETLDGLQRTRIDLGESIYIQSAPAHDFKLSFFGRRRIGRTMFETDRIPDGWRERCQEMDEIWVPSKFNRETFVRSGVDAGKVRVVPAGVDTEMFRPDLVPFPLPITDRFKFLSIFEWIDRKGADILLRAYLREFQPDEGVALVLRAYGRPDSSADLAPRLAHFVERVAGLPLEKAPSIYLLRGFMKNADIPRLYAAADAFVLPSRGEGYGRPYLEALSCAVPVIATAWSGQMDFLNEQNSFLVEPEAVVPVPASVDSELYAGHCWAEPSVEALQQQMRRVFNDRAEARGRAWKGREDMRRYWDWSVVLDQWQAQIERLSD